ncbi:hypothetical protein PQG67_06975 [Corynebacterium pseudodiphtheriticum]|uniref:hypothetical protein n=1 Tax=Corynebacterium pseudodiphtheriticum TaxID=37637 RepID=UPI00234C283E|nr:hypothetical protein [Corynebacterium pseudodiphtheriticum]MDC7086690.1 hypothetical protein [Corynebacterium pseudodiphtheriticum]
MVAAELGVEFFDVMALDIAPGAIALGVLFAPVPVVFDAREGIHFVHVGAYEVACVEFPQPGSFA